MAEAEAGARPLTGDGDVVNHMELIQGVVGRMSQNSSNVKTWAVGLIAATFALTAEKDVRSAFVLIALIPTVTFCLLDGYYLQ